MRPSVQGVDPPVCCVLDVTVTYARDSFVDSQAGPFVLSGGGPRYPGCYCYICKRQFLWIHRLGLLSSRGGGRYPGTDILAPGLQYDVLFMKCCISFIPDVTGYLPKSSTFVSSVHRILAQKYQG